MTRPVPTGSRTGNRRYPALAVVAVVAISSSAALVRWADAPPEALAFWRTAGGALILAPAARASRRSSATEPTGSSPGGPTGSSPSGPTLSQWGLIAMAGGALALHFSTWLASLELTSAAASVTLVTTAPLLIAIGSALAGRRPPARTWLAVGTALAGVGAITIGDAAGSGAPGPFTPAGSSPLLGDGLAGIGAAAMAVYLVAGDRVRAQLSTPAYAARAYGVAAAGLAVYAAIGGIDLVGYDRRTWLAIGAMVLGPQLAGHTVLNLLLARFGSVTVSTLLLAEPVGAALLVWLLFGEVPPAAAWIGAPLVVGAVALQLRTVERSVGPTGPRLSGGGRRGAGRPWPGR